MLILFFRKFTLMITFKQIDHIHICVPSERLEEARQFYTDVIGLKETDRPNVFKDPGIWYGVGNIELHVGVEPPSKQTIRHSAFEVTDIAAARKHIEAHGLRIIEEPVIEGRIRFAFLDPFDNRMELLQKI
jgi:catechol 2,3-dioxygenase-like lactoylglutathione lyase family enzyme